MKSSKMTEAVYTGNKINEELIINNEKINNINAGADASVRPEHKGNTQKGITLLALIITIIVLLILSVVSIKLLNNAGVISHSKRAVKQYQEAEFEEKINLIFSSYVMKNYSGGKINNKEITNKVLNIFNYPNINEETGELKKAEEGTTDTYTITATNGNVTVISTKTKEINLQVDYDIYDKPDFQIIYNGKIYKYKNYKLESKTDYYIEAKDESEWGYSELEDGTLEIGHYKGNGIQNNETKLVDLVVPNKINGKVVSKACFYWPDRLSNITGKLTISPGISLEYYPMRAFSKIKELELMDNVKNKEENGGTGLCLTANETLETIILHKGVSISSLGLGKNSSVLKNIVLDGSVTLTGSIESNKLTNETVNNLVNNATIKTTIFNNLNFVEPINLIITKDTNSSSEYIFDQCTNINSVKIENGKNVKKILKNSNIKLFEMEDNSSFAGINGGTIETVNIKNNCSTGGYMIQNCVVSNFNIGNDFKSLHNTPILNSVTGLKKVVVGNNFNVTSEFYVAVFSNVPDLEEIIIGDNAIISGKLLQGSDAWKKDCNVKKITLGENSKYITYQSSGVTFYIFKQAYNLEEVVFGKGTNIEQQTFSQDRC